MSNLLFIPFTDLTGVNVEDEGVFVAFRPTLNFIGADVSAVDDPPNDRVNITISAPADRARVIDYEVPAAPDTISFAGSAAEQAFATALSVPANLLVAGTVLQLVWHVELTTTGAQTVRWRIRFNALGGTALLDTGFLSASAVTTTSFAYVFNVLGTDVAGAAAPVFTNYLRAPGIGSGSSVNQPVNIATNAQMDFLLTAQTSAVGANTFEVTAASATLINP